MSFFNLDRILAMFTNQYHCSKCGALMEWEDEHEEVLICTNCGNEETSDHYGFTDEEYESLYPTREEVLGYEDDEEDDDEYNGETYDEVYGELSDD